MVRSTRAASSSVMETEMRHIVALTIGVASSAALAQHYELSFAPDPKNNTVTEAKFLASREFQTAPVHGRLLFHRNGYLRFSEGPLWEDRLPTGAHNPTINNTTQNGLLGACFETKEKFGDRRVVWLCRVLRNGQLESTDHGATGQFFDGEYNPRQSGSVRVAKGVIQ